MIGKRIQSSKLRMTVACGEWFYVGIFEDGHLVGYPQNSWKTLNTNLEGFEDMTFTQVDACRRGFVALSSTGEVVDSTINNVGITSIGGTIVKVSVGAQEFVLLLNTGKVVYEGHGRFKSTLEKLTDVVYISMENDVLSVITADGKLYAFLRASAKPIIIEPPEGSILTQASAIFSDKSIHAIAVDNNGNLFICESDNTFKYLESKDTYRKVQINENKVIWGITTSHKLWRLDTNSQALTDRKTDNVSDFSLGTDSYVILYNDGSIESDSYVPDKKFMVRNKGLVKSAMKK